MILLRVSGTLSPHRGGDHCSRLAVLAGAVDLAFNPIVRLPAIHARGPKNKVPNLIRIAAARQTLLVRKRGASAFMQPGGKIDPSEAPDAALVREFKEEIDLDVEPASFEALGAFSAEASNEPEHRVHADVFLVRTEQAHFHPAAEIEEVRWVSPFDAGGVALAPLTADHIFPHYRELIGRSTRRR